MRFAPKRSRRLLAGLVAAGALAVGVGAAFAAPVSYTGLLEGSGSVAGSVPEASIGNPAVWDYYCFWGNSGDAVTLFGERTDEGADMAMTLFHGVTNKSDDLTATSSGQAGLTWVAFRDDEVPNPGPFGDPLYDEALPSNGRYTLGVYEFLGDTATPDYNLQHTGLGQSTQSDLSDARDDVGALVLTGNQAILRRDTVYNNFLANAIADANTDSCGLGFVAAARQARSGFNYLRTPNAELAAASVGIRADIYDAVERMADTRFGEVSAWGEAPPNRLSQAAGHIANAANNPGTDAALVQLISAIDILKGETPQIP